LLLNCHTCYSLCYGVLSPEMLLQQALELGYTELVITDINNTSAILDSVRIAPTIGIKVIAGIDFRNNNEQLYIGIAKNNDGFKELNEFLSYHLMNHIPFKSRPPKMEHVFFIYPFTSSSVLYELAANEWLGIAPAQLLQLNLLKNIQLEKKCVVLFSVSFLNKINFNTHRLLRAIDNNVLLSKLDKDQEGQVQHQLIAHNLLLQLYANYPIIINNTRTLIEACHIEFIYGKFSNKNRKSYTNSVEEDNKLLKELAYQGVSYRYTAINQDIIDRIEKELTIIQQMSFASYFLINWDIIQYAQSKNYFYVGRGSGANSMVAYLIRITDVDPIDLDLYFERFINPFRSTPPDFDIDFSWTDRDDITRYIFERFGYKNTALLATYSTFQHDAVIRELGKVFGLPTAEIDKLQNKYTTDEADSMGKLVLKYSKLIHGLPRHLSIHSSGIIISDEPITTYTATFMPPKGYPTTQFSMIEAEDIGLYKLDILSQRGLGKIKDAVSIVKQNRQVDVDIHNIVLFKNDTAVKKLLSEGQCIGCFYIESPAMRMLLAKLNADDYKRLVAASSIIRPGVSKSGMMAEYIKRYRDPKLREKARNELPELYDILAETYGVMVYQEDVIKVAHYLAGLTLAEADYLRRGMSWKFKQRNEFEKVKENFFLNCAKKEISKIKTEEIWHQIESFANYAFSKAHSASYAVESMQALYLKAYFPLEYMVATLNNGGGFYSTELYFHEARMHGATIKPPCLNNSLAIHCIKDTTIYIGLSLIANLESNSIKTILANREMHGPFISLYDFINRINISIDQLRLLIRVGAFGNIAINKTKKELLWDAILYHQPSVGLQKQELFFAEPMNYQLPALFYHTLDNAFDEIELLGFALCSPFELVANKIDVNFTAKDLLTNINKTVTIVGYLVTAKRTITSKGDRMFFGTFIDINGHWIDTVHFATAAKLYPLKGPGCYSITGKVVVEFDFVYINVTKIERLPSVNKEDILKLKTG
jgi:DNA polymerase-3 subunit alpha